MSATSTVLISGANSGVGLAAASELAASTSYHILLGSRSIEKGEKAKRQLELDGSRGLISVVQLDITDKSSIDHAVKYVETEFGRLDSLINNAGIFYGNLDMHSARELLETNLFGTLQMTTAFVPLLRKSPCPRLINVSSDLGSVGMLAERQFNWDFMRAEAYRVSKAAVNMLTVCHSLSFRDWGCKVWSYDPGFVATNAWGDGEEEKQRMQDAGAGDVWETGRGLAAIAKGERDQECGCFLHKSGQHAW